MGADLAFVLCASEAAVPIKCYGPELMVVPVYDSLAFEDLAAALPSSVFLGGGHNNAPAATKGGPKGGPKGVPKGAAASTEGCVLKEGALSGGGAGDGDEEAAIAAAEEAVVASVAAAVAVLGRAHSLLIGPGLGRNPLTLEVAWRTIQWAIHHTKSEYMGI